MTIWMAAVAVVIASTDVPPPRTWVSQQTVGVDAPFWVHVEATGTDVTMPDMLQCPGLIIDPIDVRYAVFSPTRSENETQTFRRSFLARIHEPGTVTIPFQEVMVDGQRMLTEAVTVTAVTRPDLTGPSRMDGRDFNREDIVFIDMAVDRRDVYQGEPIFFKTQLWRVISPQIDSGPYGESRILLPSTEGFFVENLDPLSYTESRGVWDYDVWEERMILYPTVVGNVTIGRWHWEGVALIDTPGRRRRDRLYYKLNVGPIPITVRPLPASPAGFSGSVGQFGVHADSETTNPLQGVPFKLAVTIKGRGNPYAMGDPELPPIAWADVAGPVRELLAHDVDESGRQWIERRFTFTLTPLRSGDFRMDGAEFTFFDPELKTFSKINSEPIHYVVTPSMELAGALVVADGNALEEGEVEILGEDIRPVMPRSGTLEADRGAMLSLVVLTSMPVLTFFGLAGYSRRQRAHQPPRAAQTVADARQGLEAAAGMDDPYGHIQRVLSGFLAGQVQRSLEGLTAEDLATELAGRNIPEKLQNDLAAIWQTCERARYGKGAHADARDVQQIIHQARLCVDEIGRTPRRGQDLS